MKHSKLRKPVTSIVMLVEEFEEFCKAAYGHPVDVTCEMDGIFIDAEEDVTEILSAYLNKTVTSVHIDDCEPAGVWITYKEKESYDGLWIFVPKLQALIHAEEGTGDNLLEEDQENGYVDYVEYQTYRLENSCEEDDGGEWMLTELLREKYPNMEACVKDLLAFIYDQEDLPYLILPRDAE